MNEKIDKAAIENVPVGDIYVGKRLRNVNESKVDEYKDSIEKTGLLHPIVVDANYNLIAGMHRLEAFKMLKRKTIPAKVVEIDNPHQAILMEAEENLQTSELSVLEQAIHLTAKDDAIRALGMRRQSGGVSSDDAITTDEQASQAGIDKFLLYRLWRIGRGLSERAIQALLDTDAANKKVLLLKIAEIEDQDVQLRIALRVSKLKRATLKAARKIFREEGCEVGDAIEQAIDFTSRKTMQRKLTSTVRKIKLVLDQAVEKLEGAGSADLEHLKAAPDVVAKLVELLKAEGVEVKKPGSIASHKGHETRKRQKAVRKGARSIWTVLETSMPTEADADKNGEVLVWNASSGTVGRAKWNKLKKAHSHWQKIVSPWGEADDDISE